MNDLQLASYLASTGGKALLERMTRLPWSLLPGCLVAWRIRALIAKARVQWGDKTSG